MTFCNVQLELEAQYGPCEVEGEGGLKERMARALALLLGEQEAAELIEKEGKVETTCEFCNEVLSCGLVLSWVLSAQGWCGSRGAGGPPKHPQRAARASPPHSAGILRPDAPRGRAGSAPPENAREGEAEAEEGRVATSPASEHLGGLPRKCESGSQF